MLTFGPEDIVGLRSPGGKQFADFMNVLIRAHARANGIPDSAVRTNVRTTVGDGGVDTEVTTGSGTDVTGWMINQTAWQFKATSAHNCGPANLVLEIGKHYAKRLVEQGATFAVCIVDTLTPEQKNNRVQALRNAAYDINPQAVTPLVLDANDIATWAAEYPAIAFDWHSMPIENALSLQKWANSAIGHTPEYITNSALSAASNTIARHLTFDGAGSDTVLTVRGPVGVGKSRLVYETLKNISGADGLVLYTLEEEAAVQIAYRLSNTSKHGILVVDECTADASSRLRKILGINQSHIRAIAIESTAEDYQRDDADAIWIEVVPESTLIDILGMNFPGVQAERRRAFAHLSQGFIRFAVDLCQHDADFSANQVLVAGPVIRDYLRERLSEQELEVVAAIALVDGVGYSGEVANELNHLAGIVGLDVQLIKHVVRRIRIAPGFAATAGRFLYVRPPIVAIAAFSEAWRHWAADDPDAFLARIVEVPVLLKRFLRQASQMAHPEIRTRVARYFMDWAETLSPGNLAISADVELLVNLIEVDPDTYLPILRRIIEQTAVTRPQEDIDVPPGRRDIGHKLEHIARRTAAFPEHFRDAEAILLRLALTEPSANLRRTVSESHKRVFLPILSGTRTPFTTRLEVLAGHMRSNDENVAIHAIEILSEIFNQTYSRGVDPPLFAGRVTGEEWEPSSMAEHMSGLSDAFAHLREATSHSSEIVRREAWKLGIKKLDTLAKWGFAGRLPELFSVGQVPLDLRTEAISRSEWIIAASERHGDTSANENLRSLVESLQPTSLHERLVVAVGAMRWQQTAFDREQVWLDRISGLAKELNETRGALASELDWLCAEEAFASYELGRAVGALDSGAEALGLVVVAAARFPNAQFPCGYVSGLAAQSGAPLGLVNDAIDALESDAPAIAFSLAVCVGEDVRAIERALRLVDSGAVPASRLSIFTAGIDRRPLTEKEYQDVLTRLVVAAEREDLGAGGRALEFAYHRVDRQHGQPKKKQVLRLTPIRELIWRLIETTATDPDSEEYAWNALAETLIIVDGERVVELAGKALRADSHWQQELARELLLRLAPDHPASVMNRVGQFLVEDSDNYYQSQRDIIGILPSTTVRTWVEDRGADGILAVARHLPRPVLLENGTVEVPEITEILLRDYGIEDFVVEEFCQGTLIRGAGDDRDEQGRIISTDIRMMVKIAEPAPALLDHPSRPLHDWARWIQRELESRSDLHARLDVHVAEQRFL